jgi:hypothetical protein
LAGSRNQATPDARPKASKAIRVDHISEPPTSDIANFRVLVLSGANQTMKKTFNVPVRWAFTVMGALPLPAAAQAPPRNHDTSAIWSSQNGALYDLDVLTSRAFDEWAPLRSGRLSIGATDPWAQDILICEPQRSISIDP